MKKSAHIAMLLTLSATFAASGGNGLCFSQDVTPVGTANQKEDVPNKTQLKEWIGQLGNPNYRKREQASEKLKKGGLPAAAALLQAVHSDDLEVSLRAKQLLAHLLKAHDPPDENVSLDTLDVLACQQSPAVCQWAMKALARRYEKGDQNMKQTLEKSILKKLCKSENKELSNAALDILYPPPSDIKTIKVLKNITVEEARIRRWQRETKELQDNHDLGKAARRYRIESHQKSIRHAEKTIVRLEEILMSYRIQAKKGDNNTKDAHDKGVLKNPADIGNQGEAGKLRDMSYRWTSDYSTRRLLNAKAITGQQIQLYQHKIKELERTDSLEASRKADIESHQNVITYLQEELQWFEEEIKERRIMKPNKQ